MNIGAPIEDLAFRRSATLSAATIFIAGEGLLWCAALAAVNPMLKSLCDGLGITNCSTVDVRYLLAAAVPGVLLIAVAVPLWRRRRWAWIAALSMQGLLAAGVALATLSLVFSVNSGRSPGQFAPDMVVGWLLTLIQLAIYEIPQVVIITLLITRSARRSLLGTVGSGGA